MTDETIRERVARAIIDASVEFKGKAERGEVFTGIRKVGDSVLFLFGLEHLGKESDVLFVPMMLKVTDAAIAAHLQALADAGFVVAPREPTEAMLDKISEAFRIAWWAADNNCRRDAYQAMLTAFGWEE